MRRVTVRVDRDYCQVDGFPKHRYSIPLRLLEKFESGEISQKELQHLGHHIFLSLFPDRERQRLVLPSQGEKVLIVVESEEQEVHNIPFELICNDPGLPPEAGFLLKNPNVSLVRTVPSVRLERPPLKRPLRVLFVLSQPLKVMENAPIDPLREVKRIKDALKKYIDSGWVELKVEVKASLQHLRNRLKEGYDIVHFSGHGEEGGFLYLEDDEKPEDYRRASPQEIVSIFSESPLPYLIYIDACETSKGGSFLPSLTYRLHRSLGGVAVVGNISTISDRGAAESVKPFYSRLFEGYPHLMVSAIRIMPGYNEWYKTVCFAFPDLKLFEKPEIEREKEGVKHFRRIGGSNRYYVYRYDLVRKTADAVDRDNHLFLHGIAGMGKSTLAEYLCEFFESEFKNVIFVDFEEEEIETPTEFLEYLADFFEFEEDENPVKALKNLKESLKSEKLLLILDNVDYSVQEESGKVKKEWRRFLTELLGSTNIFTVFTSRLKLFVSKRLPLTNTITVSEFTEPDLLLLSQWLDDEEKELLFSGIEKLKGELGLYPYAVTTWLENRLPVEAVKNVLKEKLQREKGDAVEFYGSYFRHYPELNLIATLPYPPGKRFISVEYPHLVEVISRLALAKDSGDHYEFFRALTLFTNEELKEKEVEKFLRKIESFEEKSLYDYLNWLHLSPKKLEPLRELLSKYGHQGIHYVSPETAKQAVKELKVLKSSIPDQDYARVLNNLAALLYDKGEIEEAEKYYREALEICRELKSKNDAYLPDYAMSLNNLAALLYDKGEIEEAEKYYREALEICRELKSKNDAYFPDYAGVLNNLANLLYGKGEIEEAEKLYREALKIRRELKSKNDAYLPYYAMSLNNLAALLYGKGEIEEAEKLYREALKICRELKSKNDAYFPDYAGVLNNLANLLYGKGEIEEAEKLYREALKIRRELKSKNDAYLPYYAMSLNNLANLLDDKGEIEEAEKLYREALEIYRELKSKNDAYLPYYAMSLNNLANLLDDKGEIEEAEKLYREALKIRRELKSKNNAYLPDYAGVLNNLANLLYNKGEIDEAEKYYREALKIYRELKSKSDAYLPDYATSLNNLANLLYNKGKIEEAEKLFREALEICRELKSKNDAYLPDYAMSLNNLANLLDDKGEIDEAEKYYREALEVYRDALRKKVAFSESRLLSYFKNWLYLRIVLGVKGNKEIFEKLCELLAYEGVLKTGGSFSNFLVSRLSSLSKSEKESILSDLKESFDSVSHFLSLPCKNTVSDFINSLENSLKSKEERL